MPARELKASMPPRPIRKIQMDRDFFFQGPPPYFDELGLYRLSDAHARLANPP